MASFFGSYVDKNETACRMAGAKR